MVEAPVSGIGRLVAWTVIRRAPTSFKGRSPYVVIVVDLDCGLRVTGRGNGEIDSFTAGAPMRCTGRDEDTAFFDVTRERQT